jgi:DNA-binding protein HU-beta
MTKTQLLEAVHQQYTKAHKSKGNGNGALSKREIGRLLDMAFDLITQTVKRDEPVRYTGFGTWKLRKTKARAGRNPQTGEKLRIAASKNLGFVAAKPVKRALAGSGGKRQKVA